GPAAAGEGTGGGVGGGQGLAAAGGEGGAEGAGAAGQGAVGRQGRGGGAAAGVNDPRVARRRVIERGQGRPRETDGVAGGGAGRGADAEAAGGGGADGHGGAAREAAGRRVGDRKRAAACRPERGDEIARAVGQDAVGGQSGLGVVAAETDGSGV